MRKLLSLGIALVMISSLAGCKGGSSPHVLESQLEEKAFDVEAGPIWSNEHAKTRCPEVADEWAKTHPGWQAEWTGSWTTTVWGEMSVCNIKVKRLH